MGISKDKKKYFNKHWKNALDTVYWLFYHKIKNLCHFKSGIFLEQHLTLCLIILKVRKVLYYLYTIFEISKHSMHHIANANTIFLKYLFSIFLRVTV